MSPFKTLLLALLFSTQLFAQTEKPNYSILWSIKGNGLEKPSYLFGSMHVKDPRAFEFSDALLLKIEECEAFATELPLDTLIKYAAFDAQDALKEKKADPFAGPSFGGGMPSFEKLIPGAKQVQKPTFLDAYLSNIARKTGKKLYGLERWEDQMEVIEPPEEQEEGEDKPKPKFRFPSLADAFRPSFMGERLIKTYQTGDLEKIEAYVEEKEMIDAIMIKRNKVMANQIEKISKSQSLFTVVGVAHLPGKDGVIDLLRKKGFILEPVEAVFSGEEKQFKPKLQDLPWHTLEKSKKGFQIDFPRKPYSLAYTDELMMDVFPDLETGLLYYAFDVQLSNPLPDEEILKQVVDNLSNKPQYADADVKDIKQNEKLGKEFIFPAGDKSYYHRLQVFVANGYLFVMQIVSGEEYLYAHDAERFFNSLKFEEINRDWQEFKHKEGAFSLQMPGEPSHQELITPIPDSPESPPYIIHIFGATEEEHNSVFLFRYNNMPVGFYVTSDSVILEEMAEVVGDPSGGEIYETHALELDGYTGKEFNFTLADDSFLRMQMYLRGNRSYLLLHQYLKEEHRALGNDFFSSFRFEEYDKGVMEQQELADNQASLLLPDNFRHEIDSSTNWYDSRIEITHNYSSTEPNSGSTFGVEVNIYNDLVEYENQDSFLVENVDLLLENVDSIYVKRRIEVPRGIGMELIYKQKDVSSFFHFQLLLFDNKEFSLTANYPNELRNHPLIEDYFKSFRYKGEVGKINLFESKSQRILDGLVSTDSLVYDKAFNALDFHEFKEEDRRGIYKVLAQKIHFEESDAYYSAKRDLLAALSNIYDEKTVTVLKSLFDNEHIRPFDKEFLFHTLAVIGTEEAMEAHFEMAPSMKADSNDFYMRPLDSFIDSLALANEYLSDIMALVDKDYFRSSVLRISYEMLEDSLDYSSDVEPYIPALLEISENLREELKEAALDEEKHRDIEYDLYYCLQIFMHFLDESTCKEEVEAITALNSTYLNYNYAITSFKKGLPLNSNDLMPILEDSSYLYYLLLQAEKYKRLDGLPQKELTQAKIAESALIYRVDEYWGELEEIQFIREEETKYRGTKGRIYIYKYRFAEEKDEKSGKDIWYLGISGLQPMNRSKYSLENELVFDADDPFDPYKMDSEISDLIQAAKEWRFRAETEREESEEER